MTSVPGRTVYLESFGCQMNAFDTEVIESMLRKEGFAAVPEPDGADVILVNTCSIRDHAERRAIGRLHDLSRHRKAVHVVCGCMAQRLGDRLRDLVPGIDIIAGPDTYRELAAAIVSRCGGGGTATMLSRDGGVTYGLSESGGGSVSRYLSITRGCENYCSYCIVPYVRGPIRSKKAGEIMRELRLLEDAGTREVTLLGQNVMAYREDDGGFVDLLELILRETGLARIRFLTTHPRDVDPSLFALMSASRRICPHLHLPLQAGDDNVLKRMNRGYTAAQYCSIVDRARAEIPGISFSTDIIVGFPGESREDFERTVEIVERVRFDSAFTFKYSPREGTAAARTKDDVPPAEKAYRLDRLNAVVRRIREETLGRLVGSREEILLDGVVQKGEYRFL
ncbi:MAG: tRNA (N6-isopentenyl adenosine(37)-C2)-methylthiotransferase MiaB, partial [Candidatus Krumholzibacteria bacterium]|nr:tRNA (N6-isopentenyl adenosine(37)-C2)-methylthiotransferase MiaB [Candidatus Krumholzibacteria bacterium]